MTASTNMPVISPIFNFIFICDNITVLFFSLGAVVFLMSFIYSLEYMKNEEHKKRYYAFYIMTAVIYSLLCFAGNFITYYFLFEFLTLLSFPLVLHEGTKQAKLAGLKYLFYSLAGAYMVLFALYFSANIAVFKMGGSMVEKGLLTVMTEHPVLMLVCAMLIISGFGVKAGLFPMHAWLTSAHPIAPSPASAVLSGAIVKMGVLGILRGIYFLYGQTAIKGTWVQPAWMIAALITVFMGSMLAYREDNLKRRLAYSTISQVSYILFGLATFTVDGYKGSLLHVLAHGIAKCGLFLCAGAIIFKTGKKNASELKGIGKQMPVTLGCFTVFSFSLIGIPLTGGFMSKWYLLLGSFKSGVFVIDILGSVILMISALLTAGYLLVPIVNAFFPGKDFDSSNLENKDPGICMKLPMIVLAVLTIILGLMPDIII